MVSAQNLKRERELQRIVTNPLVETKFYVTIEERQNSQRLSRLIYLLSYFVRFLGSRTVNHHILSPPVINEYCIDSGVSVILLILLFDEIIQ